MPSVPFSAVYCNGLAAREGFALHLAPGGGRKDPKDRKASTRQTIPRNQASREATAREPIPATRIRRLRRPIRRESRKEYRLKETKILAKSKYKSTTIS